MLRRSAPPPPPRSCLARPYWFRQHNYFYMLSTRGPRLRMQIRGRVKLSPPEKWFYRFLFYQGKITFKMKVFNNPGTKLNAIDSEEPQRAEPR